jgi:hypothetical protein
VALAEQRVRKTAQRAYVVILPGEDAGIGVCDVMGDQGIDGRIFYHHFVRAGNEVLTKYGGFITTGISIKGSQKSSGKAQVPEIDLHVIELNGLLTYKEKLKIKS